MKKIRTRFLLIFCSISFVSALTSAAIVFSMYSSYIGRTVEERLQSGLTMMSTQLDLSEQEEQIEYGRAYNDDYVAILSELVIIAEAYGFDSIYTLQRLDNGSYRFILDSGNLEDPEDSDFLDVYADVPVEIKQAYAQQQNVFSEPYTDEWGTYISLFSPIVKGGKAIGVVGLDLEVGVVQGLYQRAYKGCALAIVIAMLLTVVISLLVAKGISAPLEKTVEMIKQLGGGNLAPRLNLTRDDEIGQLANELDAFADNLQNEILESFNRLSEGDFTFVAQGLIAEPLAKANTALNQVMTQLRESSNYIASGGSQISTSSQQLSQNATDQASSLEQITSSTTEITAQTAQNADNASQADQVSRQAMKDAENGSHHMQQLVEAMAEINDAAVDISKVIKVIDEIAFQTNLLALNAAVEAARAGQHGKGFAVVAEEVRNLAARSAKAAKETETLIQGARQRAETGGIIADRTAKSLGEIVAGITRTTDIVGEISSASQEQAEGLGQIEQGLHRIDQVTQATAASAEQCAAAAVELSGISDVLQRKIGEFQLVEDTRRISVLHRS